MATQEVDVLDTNGALVRVVPADEIAYWSSRHPGFRFREHHLAAAAATAAAGSQPIATTSDVLVAADQAIAAVVSADVELATTCVIAIARYLELRGAL